MAYVGLITILCQGCLVGPVSRAMSCHMVSSDPARCSAMDGLASCKSYLIVTASGMAALHHCFAPCSNATGSGQTLAALLEGLGSALCTMLPPPSLVQLC